MTRDIPSSALGDPARLAAALGRLSDVVDQRATADPASSYTARLLAGGPAACAKKLGEEGVEAALAVAGLAPAEISAEAADVLFHLLVALRSRGVPLDAVAEVLEQREGRSGLEEKAARGASPAPGGA